MDEKKNIWPVKVQDVKRIVIDLTTGMVRFDLKTGLEEYASFSEMAEKLVGAAALSVYEYAGSLKVEFEIENTFITELGSFTFDENRASPYHSIFRFGAGKAPALSISYTMNK